MHIDLIHWCTLLHVAISRQAVDVFAVRNGKDSRQSREVKGPRNE